MLYTAPPVIPPAPPVLPNELPPLKLLLTSIKNSLAIWPDFAFDVPFSRNRTFGIESVLINDPAGVRHVMATNASNYVRPPVVSRIMRPLIGNGLFLAEGPEWRRQRRVLSPTFTPHNVNILLRHFTATANELTCELEACASADLSQLFQQATLNAALRALFSLPDQEERERLASLVFQYVTGPGRPQIFDGLARTENSFAFSLRRRRAFQKTWFKAVDDVIDNRRSEPGKTEHRDLLDLLIASRDPQTGSPLASSEIRDQCATMIFAGYETTARLLFWASYLLTLDKEEQARVRNEIAAFPPERVQSLNDLENWPRLRNVLLETLRLYPPVPLLLREPVTDDVIAGETVKRGVQVFIAPWVLHRHRKYWQQPTAFMPGRFEGLNAPWASGEAYLPFGYGPRICIGAIFALVESQIMLATVLQRYTLSIESKQPVLPVGRLTTLPAHCPLFTLADH